MKKTLQMVLSIIVIALLSGCDFFAQSTSPLTTSKNDTTTFTERTTTKKNDSTTIKATTTEYEYKEEFQIIYIIDGDEYTREFYYTEEDVSLVKYDGEGAFSGWFKDYAFTNGPYETYISYETDPVYFYGYTLNGNHEEAERLISLIDKFDMSDTSKVDAANEYLRSLSIEEEMKVKNIDTLYMANTVIENQKAVYNLAYQFYYQKETIQYDQNNSRRNVYSLPEDATANRNLYLDCSSYVNNVYHALFNLDVIPGDISRIDTAAIDQYARENHNKASDVLYYVDTKDYTDEQAKKDLLTEIRNELLPGDVICYRHGKTSGSAGHVMLYIGDKKFLHCTGSSTNITLGTYNPQNFTDAKTNTEANFGAVNLLSASDVFDLKTSNRYLFNNAENASSYVWSFSVIRPTNRNMILTGDGRNRFNSGIMLIEKTSDILPFTSVTTGSSINFKVTIENKNKYDLKNVEIYEKVPYGTDIKSSNIEYTMKGDDYIFNVNVKAGETFILEYTLEIKNQTILNGFLLEEETTVNKIKTNRLYYFIRPDMDYSILKSYYENCISKDASSMVSIFKNAYHELFDGTIFDENIMDSYLNEKDILDDLFMDFELNGNSEAYNYLSSNMYGGVKIATTKPKDNNRIRLVTKDYLECGDMILTMTTYSNKDGNYQGFIYIDESTILGIKDGKVTCVYDTKDKVEKFLVTLVAYNEFAILKPFSH